ncbi:PLP-dependent cysteine synthase family protein [Mesorhizobium sp. NPDC059025]|uniref:PLP-dependent cysteine synthase family protein n=1 Tax=unclassified Mesorhizobium TaxID=325217 RepID=UPI0036AA90BA
MSELIGKTPILRVPFRNNGVELFIKLEVFNPCGSMKDRMALSMLDAVERRSGRHDGLRIVESSSGNTATALSMLCAEREYKFTAVMDSHAAPDKVSAVQALGGEVMLIGGGGKLVTAERDEIAHQLADQDEWTYCTEQHDNPANAEGYANLAQELLDDLEGSIDCLIGAIGTGGSLCGTARELKKSLPSIRIVGVEPEGSIIFGGPAKSYLQSGTGTPDGANVGLVIDYDVIDEGRKVSDPNAFATCRVLAENFGLMVGGSAGGSIFEAIQYCLDAPRGSRVVTLACDTGFKYMDSIFKDDWLYNKIPEIDMYRNSIHHLIVHNTGLQENKSLARIRRMKSS